jgi:hypothetical protein
MVLTTAPPFVYLVNFITASINGHRCSRVALLRRLRQLFF